MKYNVDSKSWVMYLCLLVSLHALASVSHRCCSLFVHFKMFLLLWDPFQISFYSRESRSYLTNRYRYGQGQKGLAEQGSDIKDQRGSKRIQTLQSSRPEAPSWWKASYTAGGFSGCVFWATEHASCSSRKNWLSWVWWMWRSPGTTLCWSFSLRGSTPSLELEVSRM